MFENVEWFKEFFDELYAKTYMLLESEERNEKEASLISEMLQLSTGSKLLDLACGYGRHLVYLAKKGYQVVGVDLSETLLRWLRKE